jgi:AraC-like DNA-binding protein
VLPDGCTDIIWRTGSGAFIAGPDTGPAITPTRHQEVILGVRLRPGAGGAAYGLPLSEIRDLRVPLTDLGLDPANQLHGGLDPQEAVARLAGLVGQLALARRPDPAVRAAAVRLSDPRQRVEALAGDLGFSERQLRRRFDHAVGYGPKTLQRVLRLQRFRALTGLDLGRAAAEAGYTDQAHLTHDCRRLTGLTPTELRRFYSELPGDLRALHDEGWTKFLARLVRLTAGSEPPAYPEGDVR